ncbi:head GIN domain-containing protein [Mucilaginibacter jinjuensis]|uniref:DUF2807 domain-containing protein n=1 Tax=Mucilaginibacter jinjuensis TaxID=1176721 RepID=A0ABY7TA78_9SPHI|nr:head GIN domain-containing protein [Mucilaginibacter jinjuensis]WCT12846.1 DUF2807 domain-containing protein [Mucilaginibacter jinjuensis]
MKKLTLSLFAVALAITTTLKATAQDTAQQTRDVSGYSSVSVSGPFKVKVILGDKEGAKLNIDKEYIDKVETVVDGGTLNVRFKRPSFSLKHEEYHPKTAEVTVYVRTLSTVTNTGSGNTSVEGNVTASDFKVSLSGSGSINVPTAKVSGELTAKVSGSGSIEIAGTSASVTAFISGSGQIKAKEFSTQKAGITVSGSGDVYIKADKELTATLVGTGNVYYTGNAVVTKHKVGPGNVQKM